MPRIPMYQQQQSLPTSGAGVRVEPSEMLAEQAAARKTGAAVMDLGETVAIRGHQIQADIDEKRTLDEFAAFDSEARQYVLKQRQVIGKSAIRTNEDGTFALNTDAEKWHADKIDAYVGNLDNENQKRAFRKLATSQTDQNLNHIASHISTEYGNYNREVRATWVQNTLDAIQLSGGDPGSIDSAVGKYQLAMKALYPGQDITELMQRDMTRFEHAAMGARSKFEETRAFNELRTKHGDNATAAVEELMKPESYPGMTVEDKQKVANIIRADITFKEQEKRRAIDDRQGKLLAEFSELKRSGKSRTSWYRNVEDMARRGEVTDEFQRSAISMLNQDIQEAKTGGETNPVSYAALHEKVMRGAATIEEIMGAKGISFAHKNALIDKFYSKQGSEVKEAETQAKNYLKSQLVSTGPLGNPLPAEHERLFKAYEAIDVHADAARKAGKPWTVKEYMDYATQLANFYRPTIESKVRDMNSAFGTPQPAQAATTQKAEPADMKRKPGETIDQYLKRTGQE